MVELFCPTRHTDSNNEKGCRIVSDKVVLKTVTKQTLQSKLIVLLVLFAFLSAALVGGVSTYMNVTQKKDNIAESNRELTGQAASEIERCQRLDRGIGGDADGAEHGCGANQGNDCSGAAEKCLYGIDLCYGRQRHADR